MEKTLIFMYRNRCPILFLVFAVSFGLSYIVDDGMEAVCFLPFVLVVTFYYASMLWVRRRYAKGDEVRYRAHYLRGVFAPLTFIVWGAWLVAMYMLIC